MKTKFICCLIAALALVSCAKEFDENKGIEEPGGTISFVIDETESKVSLDTATLKMSFEIGDIVAINDVTYQVSTDVLGNKVIEGVKLAGDGIYKCIFEGDHSYIGTSDNNYKVQNYQFYREGNIGRNAMPSFCYKVMKEDSDNTLSFTPLLGVIRIPVIADDIEISTIKLENAAYSATTPTTYMTGRFEPFKSDGTRLTGFDPEMAYLAQNGGTALMRDLVLMCRDSEGNGVKVNGKKDFLLAVGQRTYTNGLRLTINTVNHLSMTVATSAATTVKAGEYLTMQPVTWAPDSNLIYSENFDSMILGADPVAHNTGATGWRCLLCVGKSSTEGTFATSSATGFESAHWYSSDASVTDQSGRTYKICCPGSDIIANYHANVPSTTYFDMSGNDTRVMSESWVKSRGLWDWCISRGLEYHGYMMVGRSAGFSSLSSASGVTATGSPQGMVQTPKLTNIPEAESRDVRFSIKLSPDYTNPYQNITISCYGGGLIVSGSCGAQTVKLNDAGNVATISGVSSMPSGWSTCELLIKGVTNGTFFIIQSPDGKDDSSNKYKTTTFFIDDLRVEEYNVDEPGTAHRVAFIGDSITTFAGYCTGGGYFYPYTDPDGDVKKTLTSVRDTYWYKLVYNLMGGENTVDKVLAYGGTTVINNEKSPRTDFLYRLQNDRFVNPDIVFIHGGTNDHNYSSPLGDYDYDVAIDNLDEKSFRPAYIKLIKMIQRDYPSAQILIIIGDMLSENYYTSIETIANHMGIPYVSFTGDSVSKCKGSHPNIAGMDFIANKTYNTLKSYLK